MQDRYLFPFSSIITLMDPSQIGGSRGDTSAARFELTTEWKGGLPLKIAANSLQFSLPHCRLSGQQNESRYYQLFKNTSKIIH